MKNFSRRFLFYFGLAWLLSSVVFFPSLDNYFAGDDWPAILRNTDLSWPLLVDWFTGLHAGWYRPVHDIFINLCWRLFKLNPIGYRLASILVYALVSASVGLLIDIITRDRRISILAVVLFALFATHSEPVLWFAGTNELLAGLFLLVSVICYILSRETGYYSLLIVAVISGFLAFASKETALFFPILLLFYDGLLFLEIAPRYRSWSFFFPFLAMMLLWVGFLLFRLPLGSAYAETVTTISPVAMIKNLIYYILIEVFVLPNNYAFVSALPLWRSAPILPVIILILAASLMAVLAIVWLRNRLFANKRYRHNLLFAGVWTVVAWGPVIFIITERAAFLSSIGLAATFSILLIGAWDAAKDNGIWWKRVISLVIILYIGLNTVVLTYRSRWFEQSADQNQAVLEQLGQELAQIEAGTKILIANLPDHTQYTFTFRNTFPAALQLLQYPVEVIPIFDIELAGKSVEQQAVYVRQMAQETGCEIIYWYHQGQLVRQPTNQQARQLRTR